MDRIEIIHTPPTASESFWDYSNRIYRKTGVTQCCLSLQDLYGLDVNLLLFACWHARSRGLFAPAMLNDALAFSSAWSVHVVNPLRNARRWMKTQMQNDALPLEDTAFTAKFSNLREQIKGIELQCEKFQEHTLESLATAPELSLSLEMQITSAVYNLHCLLDDGANPPHIPPPLPLRDFLAALILNALDQDPDDPVILQAVSRELTVQAHDLPADVRR